MTVRNSIILIGVEIKLKYDRLIMPDIVLLRAIYSQCIEPTIYYVIILQEQFSLSHPLSSPSLSSSLSLTSIEWWISIECSIILLDGLAQVVSCQVVLAHVVVKAPYVVEVEGSQALTRLADNGRLGSHGQHLESLGVVTGKVLHVRLQKVSTRRLQGIKKRTAVFFLRMVKFWTPRNAEFCDLHF